METGNEGESFQLHCLRKLVEKLTTSGSPVLDVKQMKSLKKICKSSNKYIQELFKLLLKQLRKKHGEIRLSSFQICHEIFMRSHSFRQLICDNLDTVYKLTILLNRNGPPLKPVQAAQKLITTAINSLHEWHENFGDGYVYLKSGYEYLKGVENVDFESATISTEQDRRRREERLRKEEEIRNLKIQNVVNEMESIADDISNNILEFKNTFKLLIPDLDNFFVSTIHDNSEDPRNQSEKSDVEDTPIENGVNGSFEYGSHSMREHGLTKETLIQVNLSRIHEVEETTDNEIIISSLKEQVSNIKNSIFPKVKKWEQTVMKYSATHRELTLKIIDIKRTLESLFTRYESVKIIPRSKKVKAIKKDEVKYDHSIQSSDDDDDFIDVPLDDPRVIQAADLEAAFLGAQTSALKEKLRNAKISSEDLVAAGSSGVNRDTKPKEAVKRKKSNFSIDSFMEDNLQEPIKFSHSVSGLTNIWSGNEVLHDHGDDVLKPSDVLGIATLAVDFEREFEPVLWECRAPLRSGRLCPRKDRKRCPLHGPVIPRNNLGAPLREEDARKEQQKREEYERAHPEWQNPTFLAEIRSATGVDLDLKRAKKRKRRYPNLTNIREHENTPYNRLQRKIFSKKSVARLNRALAKLPQ